MPSPTCRARLLATFVIGASLVACAPPPTGGSADVRADGVALTAAPLADTRPEIRDEDVAAWGRPLRGAQVVGIGGSTHGAAEQISLQHRVLRLLVERLGFRSLAWEEDWTLGLEIDEYLSGGPGDAAALVARMSPQWQFGEVADVLRWLRGFNASRADKVHFVGVEYYATPAAAHDRLEAYTARVAPERAGELASLLRPLRPGADVYAYIQAYRSAPDNQNAMRRAGEAARLVETLPHTPDDAEHALMVHTAQQIVAFHEHHRMPESDALDFREARAAQNLQWWQARSGDRVAYWASAPHTVAAPVMHIAGPPGTDLRFESAGSHLRNRYNARYRSVGVTLGAGTVALPSGGRANLAEPSPEWFERPLRAVAVDTFALDLHSPDRPGAQSWLHSASQFRGLSEGGPGAHLEGGSPDLWFDLIVHHQDATPARPVT